MGRRTLPDAKPRACRLCGTIFTPERKKAGAVFCRVLCQRRSLCNPAHNARVARETAKARGDAQRRKRGEGRSYVKLHYQRWLTRSKGGGSSVSGGL